MSSSAGSSPVRFRLGPNADAMTPMPVSPGRRARQRSVSPVRRRRHRGGAVAANKRSLVRARELEIDDDESSVSEEEEYARVRASDRFVLAPEEESETEVSSDESDEFISSNKARAIAGRMRRRLNTARSNRHDSRSLSPARGSLRRGRESSMVQYSPRRSSRSASPRRSASKERYPKRQYKSSSPLKPRTSNGGKFVPRNLRPNLLDLMDKRFKENSDGSKASSYIVEVANFRPKEERRPRVSWTDEEVDNLLAGVRRHGEMWKMILDDPDFEFNSVRTNVDLKDKYRNLVKTRDYSSIPRRQFCLVNEDHRLMRHEDTGTPYSFWNQWPTDAARKAASRDIVYDHPDDVDGVVYLREAQNHSDEAGGRASAVVKLKPVVHVYRVSRRKVRAPEHLAGFNVRYVWETDVEKVKEERLVDEAVVEDLLYQRDLAY